MNKSPINEILPELKKSLYNNQKLLLQAPPGAGKSTVIPISLLKESWLKDKIIIMLEPRRVATRMVANQMAKLLGENVGQTVGYQVKMDSLKSTNTKILVVTEAILVRKLQSDQALEDVAMVIFDEFHERSIHTDLSLALSLQVQEVLREDLKILIMSATLNSNKIAELLGDVPIITSKGKIFDVQNIYLEKNIKQPDVKNINTLLLNTTLNALKNDSGDILIFLPGVKEIKKLEKSLLEKIKDTNIVILPLYSTLKKEEQDKAIFKNSKRKIILSTNIAQTSLTIEGVKVVIDSGLEKLSRYNYSNAMDHLELNFISKDSSIQRAGRAGRLSNGKCYKLWHQDKILKQSTKAEILRADLSSLLLDLALWGIEEISELKWLDIPETKIVSDTKIVLKELHMLDKNNEITQFGKNALSLGLHPRFSYMILKANDLGFAYEACLLSAILSEKDIFTNQYANCDILSRFVHLFENDVNNNYINKYTSKEVLTQANYFYKKLNNIKKVNKKNVNLDESKIAVLLLFAYPDRLAKLRVTNDNKYKLSNGKGAILNIEDILFNEEYLVVSNINANDKNSYINRAISISLNQIEKYFSDFIKKVETIKYNKEHKKFDFRENRYFLDLELDSKPLAISKKHNIKHLLIDLIKKEGLELLTWNSKSIDLKNRINFINEQKKSNVKFNIEVEFEDFDDENLLNTLENWIEPYLENISTVKELQLLDMYNILMGVLSWENQQMLEKLAPTHIKVPSGSNIKIDYSDKQKAILSVRLQEMFGLHETPKVLNDKVALQIHLLSPAKRPIQITYDLKSFWENSYMEVRKELRGKYKKHYWPENPFEAVATSQTKKLM